MKWSLVAAAILVMILVLVAAVPNARELSPRVTPIALKNISGMAWDGEKLWITVDGEGAIYRVDAASGSIERRAAPGTEKRCGRSRTRRERSRVSIPPAERSPP